MKAIRYILLSLFQKDIFTNLSLLVSFFLYFLATGKTINHLIEGKETAFSILSATILAVLFGVFVIMIHIKSLSGLNSNILLPLYKEYLIYTILLVVGFNIFYPALILALIGISFLKSLALFSTLIVCLMLIGLIYGKLGLPVILLLFPVKIIYEILGFKSKTPIFDDSQFVSTIRGTTLISLVIITINVLLFIGILYYFYKRGGKNAINGNKENSEYFTKDFDKTDRLINVLSRTILTWKRSKFLKGDRFNVISDVSYIQHAIFSPGISFYLMSFYITLAYYCYMAAYFFIFYGQLVPSDFKIIGIVILLFVSSAGVLTVDFLQHRSRIMNLYLSYSVKGKRTLLKNVVRAYVRVSIFSYLMVSTITLLILLILGKFQVTLIGQVFLPSLAIYIGMIASSLIFSDSIKSPEVKGWIIAGSIVLFIGIFILILAAPFLIIASTNVWFHVVTFSICLGLLYYGIRKWIHSDIDFLSPDTF